MKSLPSLLVAFLALGCVACGYYSWTEYRDLLSLQASLHSPQETAGLRGQLTLAQKDFALTKKKLAAMTAPEDSDDPDTAKDKADRRAERREAKKAKALAARNDFAEMMKTPEARRLLAIQNRGWIDTQYAAVFKALNLTPDQLAKYKDLLAERNNSFQDAYQLAKDQGIDPATDPKGYSMLMQGIMTDMTNQMKAAIGDDNYQKAQQLQSMNGERATAAQLQQSLSFTQTPLTDDQANQLAQLMQANRAPRDQTAVAMIVQNAQSRVNFTGGFVAVPTASGGYTNGASLTDAAMTAAAGILSQPQLDALKQLQQFQQSEFQLGKIMTPPKTTAVAVTNK